MKLLVCISNVPDTTTKVTFTNNNTQFNTSGVQFILNPYDEIALSKAIELTEGGKGSTTVIHVGDASTEPTIRKALAIGADDAVRIDCQPGDSSFVAAQIAAYARSNNFDLILCGRESIDYNNALVPGMIAELMNQAFIPAAKKANIDGSRLVAEREIEGGKEVVEASLPAVISCTEGLAEPKIPNMRGIMSARTKPLQVIAPAQAEILTAIKEYSSPAPRTAVKIISEGEIDKLVDLLHTEAKVI